MREPGVASSTARFSVHTGVRGPTSATPRLSVQLESAERAPTYSRTDEVVPPHPVSAGTAARTAAIARTDERARCRDRIARIGWPAPPPQGPRLTADARLGDPVFGYCGAGIHRQDAHRASTRARHRDTGASLGVGAQQPVRGRASVDHDLGAGGR